MKNNRAFTLIEVMVVLSVLAIIAILAYGFFGNIYKEAIDKKVAVEVHKELVAYADAALEYERRTGSLPGAFSISSVNANGIALLGEGVMRTIPGNKGGAGWVQSGRYYQYGLTDLKCGTAANDFYVSITGINNEACQIYNDTFSTNLVGQMPGNQPALLGFLPDTTYAYNGGPCKVYMPIQCL